MRDTAAAMASPTALSGAACGTGRPSASAADARARRDRRSSAACSSGCEPRMRSSGGSGLALPQGTSSTNSLAATAIDAPHRVQHGRPEPPRKG